MSKFDRNWIKDGWEKLCTNKQTNRQKTDKQTDTTKIMFTWPWTNIQIWHIQTRYIDFSVLRCCWLGFRYGIKGVNTCRTYAKNSLSGDTRSVITWNDMTVEQKDESSSHFVALILSQ